MPETCVWLRSWLATLASMVLPPPVWHAGEVGAKPAEDWIASAVDERLGELLFSKAAESERSHQLVRAMLTEKAPDRNRVLDILARVQRGKRVPDNQQDLACSRLRRTALRECGMPMAPGSPWPSAGTREL